MSKKPITTLQINLGKRCNLACTHCHVEASPKRTEELSEEVCQQLIELIRCFPQIETVDLTGGAPEMNYGFKPLVETARSVGKNVIVRSNLTIILEPGYQDLPHYFAQHQLRIVASLPCYLQDNVDKQRGSGVYQASIAALQQLNQVGYGKEDNLILDLVYNPPIPRTSDFSLTPHQSALEQDYKKYLLQEFAISFNNLFTITNLPIGRTKQSLESKSIYEPYIEFLAHHHNPDTLDYLMCRSQLSIDYLGNIYDCDFNQMVNLVAIDEGGNKLTVKMLLDLGSLDAIKDIKTANYCYGCTAGSGSSCGGSLI